MLDSMKTPSYPSVTPVQGYLIGEILSKHDPQNSHIYHQLGEDITHSRIVKHIIHLIKNMVRYYQEFYLKV